MKRLTRTSLVVLVLMTWLISACGGTPEAIVVTEQVAATTEVVERMVEVEAPGETYYEAEFTAEPTAEPVFDAPPPDLDAPNDAPYHDVFFENYGVNPRIDTEDDALSTFAVDVDSGSYTVMRRYVNDGYLPDDDSVRVEEYVNFFEQQYSRPEEGAFAIAIDGAPSPYAEGYHLVRVGLQGYEIPAEERKDVVLTFVIDISGSMDQENRLGLVKESLALLVESLRPADKVGIVVYGSTARVILEPTQVSQSNKIMRAINRLGPGGSTNAEAGLVLGYQQAARHFDAESVNRVILCSDGVANVGLTGPDSIGERIRGYADEGIYMTSVGFGMGNYNDVMMEQLADKGDGFYAYVDTIDEAERVFVHELPSTLQVIARDAKVQVEFNPSVVSRYRLLGYENRAVADEDFRNDEVDAGEIGLGHSVTALYEIKFVEDAPERQPALTVRIRYEDPETAEVTEISEALAKADFAASFEEAAPRFQLAVVVAYYAEVLRNSYWAEDAELTLAQISQDASRVGSLFEDPEVTEFVQLAQRAASIGEP